jgi:Ubiquitin elongating factor core
VPLDFRILPEYILEDVIDYLFFAVRYALVLFVMSSCSRLSDMDHLASS